MKIQVIKKEKFEQNLVGKTLGAFLFNNSTWKENKKVVVNTRDRMSMNHPIYRAFNIVLAQLYREGVKTLIITE